MGQRNSRGIFSMAGVNPVKLVTQNVNKKGKLRGQSKRETKDLKSVCTHHLFNKQGKLKPRAEDAGTSHGKDMLRCPVCGDYYPAGFFTDPELDKAKSQFREQVSQAKMISVAIGADARTVQQMCETALYVDNFDPAYKRMRKVAEKRDKARQKKKKKKSQYGDFGGWRTR